MQNLVIIYGSLGPFQNSIITPYWGYHWFSLSYDLYKPSQKFISIGIAPPHLHLKSRLKERISYETNLRKAGAELILNSINDLKNINLDLF